MRTKAWPLCWCESLNSNARAAHIVSIENEHEGVGKTVAVWADLTQQMTASNDWSGAWRPGSAFRSRTKKVACAREIARLASVSGGSRRLTCCI